jgi:hypothetical protein
LLLGCLITPGAFAQETVVGALKNGKPVVTDLVAATTVLKGGLSSTATVVNAYIDFEPESGKYFLLGEISNSSISGKAVELKLNGTVLLAASGPGLEVTCTGDNCGRCVPRISKSKVRCVCEDIAPGVNAKCDMISKVIITAW